MCVMLKHCLFNDENWLAKMPIKNCDGFVLMQQLIGLCLNVQFISGKLIKSELYNRVRNVYSLDCNELSC